MNNRYLLIPTVIFILIILSFARDLLQPASLFQIWPQEEDFFAWPYFQYIPPNREQKEISYLLVIPNSTGYYHDDPQIHASAAREQAQEYMELAESLNVSLLIPAFPWPEHKKFSYTQTLDRNTLFTEEGDLARLDLQLLAMMDDAQKRLRTRGIEVEERTLLFGFSASGLFVNRFLFLHPDRVQAAVIGSPGGWPLAPFASWNDVFLPYPVGLGDLEEILGEVIEMKKIRSIPLLFFQGEEDSRELVGDVFAFEHEHTALIEKQFGTCIQERWSKAEAMYEEGGMDSEFVLIPQTGHWFSEEMEQLVLSFFQQQMQPEP